MKMFQVYKWDCIIRWVLFGVVALLAYLSSDAVNLISNPTTWSACALLLYLFVPVHPIFWLIALIYSIGNKQVPRIVFCIIAPIVSIVFALALIVIHVAITGGV